jgi:hypothetical protein
MHRRFGAAATTPHEREDRVLLILLLVCVALLVIAIVLAQFLGPPAATPSGTSPHMILDDGLLVLS